MKLYIKTMGCQMNEYDSEKMADVLRESHGYELTDSPDNADLLLVNTCSIREKAQEKVFSELGTLAGSSRKRNPNIKIGVGGCVASQEGEGITKRAPFVDVVFGPQTLHRLPELITDAGVSKSARLSISRFPRSRSSIDCPSRAPTDRQHSYRSWKVAASTAASVSYRIRAAKKSAVRSTM